MNTSMARMLAGKGELPFPVVVVKFRDVRNWSSLTAWGRSILFPSTKNGTLLNSSMASNAWITKLAYTLQ